MKRKVIFAIMSIFLLSALSGDAVCAAGKASGTNLALNKKYTIVSGAANDYSYTPEEKGSKDQLTDGVHGDPANCYSGLWSHFIRGVSRTITLDLGAVMAVDGFEATFIQNKRFGIYCPQELVISVSEDGISYMTLNTISNSVDNTVEIPTSVVYNASAGKSYKARYVRFYFDVQVNTFLDEIKVFGREDAGNALEITPDEKVEEKSYYDNGEGVGSKDIICFHNGYNPDEELFVNNKKDVFKPYISYVDKDGKMIDTMFDAVMFLTLQGKCPSGGKLTVDGGPTVMSDWLCLFDNTFGKDINLDALDQATADMKQELNLPETHKTGVYLTVPHPKISELVFGDYDGDGIDNKILTLEDCVDVYAWYVDLVLEKFNSNNYKNIELKGFFWSNESLSAEYYEQEPEFAELCIKELHKRNTKCVFIPYYQATGIEKAQKIGFDATIMQANLAFKETLQKNPEKMMEDFAKTAAKYHMGIQMEAADGFIYDLKKNGPLFKQYLVSSVKSGMMTDAIHAYYQGAGYGVFYKFAYSDDAYVRWFYDALYKFIKGTLYLPEFKIDITTEVTVVENEKFQGTFDIDGDWSNSEYMLSISKRPKHGIITVVLDEGIYVYRSDRGFSGDDSFTLKYMNPDGEQIEVPVKVTVTPANAVSEGIDESGDSSDVSSEKPKNKPLGKGLIYGIVGLVAVAAVAFVVFLINKKRKK